MLGRIDVRKPRNISSFGVVSRLRRLLGERRCGHSGTLDPMAEGVLSVYVGKATAFIDRLRTPTKEYIGSLRFGLCSDTQDIWGAVRKSALPIPEQSALEAILPRFTGEILQMPPMVSALKVQGKPLYKYAREGKEVERAVRTVRIESLALLRFDGVQAEFSVRCSKGTYIRTLFADLAQALGSEGVMSALLRTENDGIRLEDCFLLEEIEEMIGKEDFRFLRECGSLQPFEKAEIPAAVLEDWRKGKKTPLPAGHLRQERILATERGTFTGTALRTEDGYIPEKVI